MSGKADAGRLSTLRETRRAPPWRAPRNSAKAVYNKAVSKALYIARYRAAFKAKYKQCPRQLTSQ